MEEQIEKCDLDNVLLGENVSTIKEELNQEYIDDKVFCENTTITDNAHLEALKKNEDILTPFHEIKTEITLSELENNTVDDNVKIEEVGVNDVKFEFNNGLLWCDNCNADYEDYCNKCDMLAHIMNRNSSDSRDDDTQNEPPPFLEIQNSFGQSGVFALQIIPKDVKFGPFNGSSASDYKWMLKKGKFVLDKDISNHSNWMKHINPAKNVLEQNLQPFRYDSDLYYRSTCQIEEGDELLVYFGQEYEDSLQRNNQISFIPHVEERIKDVFACTFCCLGFRLMKFLAKHKTVCLNDEDKKLTVEELTQCPFCNVYLSEKEYSRYHMVSCCKRNVRKCIVLKPTNQTTNGRTNKKRVLIYKCSQCSYQTRYKSQLNYHANTHKELTTYRKGTLVIKPSKKKKSLMSREAACPTNKDKGRQRYSKIAGQSQLDLNSRGDELETNSKSYPNKLTGVKQQKKVGCRCKICGYETKQKIYLERHLKTKHLKEFDYVCDVCDFETNNKSNLDNHLKAKHLGKFDYECETCKFKTNYKKDLRRHIKTVHLKQFDHKCSMCDYKTNRRSHLNRHLRTLHLKLYKFKCELCEYETNHLVYLKSHVESKHFGRMKYACELCGLKTNYKHCLERHVQTKHLHEFKYNCAVCDYQTNNKSNLELHIKTLHLKDFNYQCERCPYKTNRRSYLENHLERKHFK